MSQGCKNCFIYKMDERYGRDTTIITKGKTTLERIKYCVSNDWGDGWEHVHISVSIENQEMADKKVPELLKAPVKHREVFCSPLIGPMTLTKY